MEDSRLSDIADSSFDWREFSSTPNRIWETISSMVDTVRFSTPDIPANSSRPESSKRTERSPIPSLSIESVVRRTERVMPRTMPKFA